MKKRLLKLCVILLFINFSLYSKNFLWEMKKQDKTIYLLGSVHVLRQDYYPLPQKIYEVLKKSSTLLVEADMSQSNPLKLMEFTLKKSQLQEGVEIKDVISKDCYKQLTEKFKEQGLNLEDFKNYKPWYIASMYVSMNLLKEGFSPNLGIDNHLIEKAKKEGKEIVELEGAVFQLNLLASMNKEENEEFLISTLNDESNSIESLKILLDLWKKGDNKKMEEMIFNFRKKNPKLKKLFYKLFDERNVNMSKKIIEFRNNNQGDIMVVTGAAHMLGENGIIELIKKAGYSSKQL